MKGRQPTSIDLGRMKQALGILTTYDHATEEDDFTLFRELVDEADEHLLDTMTQLSWLLLRSMEASSDYARQDILQWYGLKFAEGAEEMNREP